MCVRARKDTKMLNQSTVFFLDGENKCTIVRKHKKTYEMFPGVRQPLYKVRMCESGRMQKYVKAHLLKQRQHENCASSSSEESEDDVVVEKALPVRKMWRVVDDGRLIQVDARLMSARRVGMLGTYRVGEAVVAASSLFHKPHDVDSRFWIRKKAVQSGYVRCRVLEFSDGFYRVVDDGKDEQWVSHNDLFNTRPKLVYHRSLHNGLPIVSRQSRISRKETDRRNYVYSSQGAQRRSVSVAKKRGRAMVNKVTQSSSCSDDSSHESYESYHHESAESDDCVCDEPDSLFIDPSRPWRGFANPKKRQKAAVMIKCKEKILRR